MKRKRGPAPSSVEQESAPRPRPAFSPEEAADVLMLVYARPAETIEELTSERDQNFRIRSEGEDVVLKIAAAAETREIIEFQNEVLAFLATAAPDLGLPRVIPTGSGEAIAPVRHSSGSIHLVRLLTFLPGRFLARVRPHSPALLRSLGRFLGRLDAALEGFGRTMPARPLKWDMREAPATVRGFLLLVDDPEKRRLVEFFVDRYKRDTAPLLPRLRTGLLYNDANDHNVLVGPAEGEVSDRWSRVTGLIDFGDMIPGWTAVEPAVAAAYVMLDKPDPLAAAAHVVAGYHSARPLTDVEIACLFPFMTMRLCLSVTVAAQQHAAERDNEYLRISERPAWDLLAQLRDLHPRFAHYVLRDACGLPPVPAAGPVAERLREWGAAGRIGPVVDADLRSPGQVVLDLSAGSLELGSLSYSEDPDAVGRLARERAEAAGRQAAIGRYDEARTAYSAPQFRIPANDGPETRSIHLGIDIFMEAGAPVFAPLDGVVHSFADNAAPQDYGPAIIIEHRLPETPVFYTLYGHLSRESLAGLERGRPVGRGERIGSFGSSAENGGWPPHLHFQIMTDLLDWESEFPGVAPPSRRAVWTGLCIDPNLVLGIPEGDFPAVGRGCDEIMAERRDGLCPSLSVSYRRPLKIVRGRGQWLFDERGQAFLDTVNNVAHVGHAHPRVVEAMGRQAAVLNTNTRYLHDLIVEYARRLRVRLPEPLRVFFFVNSGSEANDLALRLAWTHARRRDLIVLEGAYHGNLSSLVDISPYKFDGPGGQGAPPHVHVAPIPDVFRGKYRGGSGMDAGAAYAAEVEAIARRLVEEGRPPSAFIHESLPSCAGQIVFPEGYLRAAYQVVREAGGICIADEVQAGFGRVGTHFWGFETQRVVPDIVTMGKPIGNGHPLGAVVTTPEVAASFRTGMEYFNTYGGNPVSCAAGLAVLDAMEQEGLQRNARDVGAFFKTELEKLREGHPIVGDVRGLGLFLGIELVRGDGGRESATRTALPGGDRQASKSDPGTGGGRAGVSGSADRETVSIRSSQTAGKSGSDPAETPEPAGEEAAYVVERLRDNSILASTDGPFHNVIKIKPPLVFTRDDAALYVETLTRILAEDPLKP